MSHACLTKRKVLYALIVLIAIGIFWCGFSMFQAVSNYSREAVNRQKIGALTYQIRNYRLEHGKFPLCLEDLLLASTPEGKNSLRSIINDEVSSVFGYEPLTNGFQFTASASTTWFQRGKSYVVRYEEDESHSIQTINGIVDIETWIRNSSTTNK